MPYMLKVKEDTVFEQGKYKNAKGNTECVEFVRQTTDAPQTTLWTQGKKISEMLNGSIKRGTAIATFDDSGRYPSDGLGRHAAIYLEHDSKRIVVLDQWKAQGEVKKREIKFGKPIGESRSNNADTFYIIE